MTHPFIGIIVMVAFVSLGVIIFLFSPTDFDALRLTIVLVVFFVIPIALGIHFAIPKFFTVNQYGITLLKGKKVKQNRSWNEIKKIATYNEDAGGGEVAVSYRVITIYFHDGKRLVLRENFWGVDPLKGVFKEMLLYQPMYRFEVRDDLNWAFL
jgi:hypothetical protein